MRRFRRPTAEPGRAGIRLGGVRAGWYWSPVRHDPANYRRGWKLVGERFGAWPVGKIEHADVAEWVADLGKVKGPDTVRLTHRVLCQVLDHAMRTRRVPINVARGVRLPPRAPAREVILTVEQVNALASAMP